MIQNQENDDVTSCLHNDDQIVSMPSWISNKNAIYNGMHVLRPIGSGGFSDVFLVQHLDGDNYALKVMPIRNKIQENLGINRMLSEVRVLKQMQPHPSILKYVFSWNDNVKPWFYLVTEYCKNGTLDKWLKSRMNITDFSMVTPNVITSIDHKYIQIILDVLLGCRQLHKSGYVHCDIKPSNIFIKESGRACLGDLGLTCAVGNKLGYSYQSALYTDDRYIGESDVPVDFYMDTYSLGITIFEIFSEFRTEMERSIEIINFRKKGNDSVAGLCIGNIEERPSDISLYWAFMQEHILCE